MAVDTVEKVIFSLLSNDNAVKALVVARIYPNIAPQGVDLPYIVYHQISGPREHVMAGALGLVHARFQINCWASTYGGARTLADAVRKELDGHSGTTGTVAIDSCMLEDEGDIGESIAGVDVLKRFGKRHDYMIWFKESTS